MSEDKWMKWMKRRLLSAALYTQSAVLLEAGHLDHRDWSLANATRTRQSRSRTVAKKSARTQQLAGVVVWRVNMRLTGRLLVLGASWAQLFGRLETESVYVRRTVDRSLCRCDHPPTSRLFHKDRNLTTTVSRCDEWSRQSDELETGKTDRICVFSEYDAQESSI